jgi:hypothetical protein
MQYLWRRYGRVCPILAAESIALDLRRLKKLSNQSIHQKTANGSDDSGS